MLATVTFPIALVDLAMGHDDVKAELVSRLEAAGIVAPTVSLRPFEEPSKAFVFPPEMTTIHTDGGCNAAKGGGLGAYAYLIQHPGGSRTENAVGMSGTTNNRMELMGVISALEAVEIGRSIVLVSDSEYVVKGCTCWSAGWVKNGWVNSMGKPVKNRDLWERLLPLYALHDVTFKWTKGHAGDEHNVYVDALCTKKINELHKKVLKGEPVPVDEGAKANQ
jgi:ribonuclease HI